MILLLFAACEAPPPPEVAGAWHQDDLTAIRKAKKRRELVGEVQTLRGRSLRSLRMKPGQATSFSLELGADAFFSFRPAAEGRCDFRLSIQKIEEPQVSQRVEALQETWSDTGINLPRTVEVDLSPWDGQRVELRLRIARGKDCVSAGWATPVVLSRRTVPPPRAGEAPNILFIAVDTLRTDALGAYGRTPSVTPAIDRLAAESDVFLNAFTSNNSTNPSFSSLMTGTWARDHLVFNQTTRLAASAQTLPELLQEAGYETLGMVSARHLGTASGIDQGFDEFVHPKRQFFAETVVHQAMTWFQERQTSEKPFFTFLHLFDAHIPHNPPAPFHLGFYTPEEGQIGAPRAWETYRQEGVRELGVNSSRGLEGSVDVYPGEVAYLDHQIGRLLAFLRSRRMLDNTIVALVADHGETLGERGEYFNHEGLHDITTRVPLMIRWPETREEGRRIEALVQHLDLFPTLLAAAGAASPWDDGQDLRSLEPGARGRRAVFSQGANANLTMVRTADHKLILATGDDSESPEGVWLFDMASDPQEMTDLAGQGLEAESELLGVLERWRAARREMEAPEHLKMNAEERKNLEALGYLQP